jgi:hypothetical protein
MTKLIVEKQLNAFTQSLSRGFVDNDQTSHTFEGILANDDDEQITSAGDLVKLVAGNGKVANFAEVEATDTEGFGFVVHNLKQRRYKKGDFIGVAGDNAIIYGVALDDIECGDKVAYVATEGDNQGKIAVDSGTLTAGLISVGIALNTVAEGGLVKFLVKLGKATGATGTATSSNTLTIVNGLITEIA